MSVTGYGLLVYKLAAVAEGTANDAVVPSVLDAHSEKNVC
jgi:hypothetical protein